MNDRFSSRPITLSIAAVERDTGLSKDTLRVWERRYGFPNPGRDATGERVYTLEQVEKLRVIKRLMDAGHRPGRIVPMSIDDLSRLSASTIDHQPQSTPTVAPVQDLRRYVDAIKAHDVDQLRGLLDQAAARMGLAPFVNEVIVPLNTLVGDGWMRGHIEVFEEHLYTESVQVVLRHNLTRLGGATREGHPRMLLTTFPGEPHGLGLLMAEALLAADGCHVVSLGVQTPVWDIVLAVRAMRTDVVGLGFTACMNPNHVVEGLVELRQKLPATVEVWVGGSAPVLHRRAIEGVQALATLGDLIPCAAGWRQRQRSAS